MIDITAIHKEILMGSWSNEEIPLLLSMAHDRSETGRVALVEKIAKIFLVSSADLSQKENTLVEQFIEEIVKNESSDIRHALISQFAHAIHAARPVAMRVSKGPIEIAQATLAANENLHDDDLISIISVKGDDHAAAIATRNEISEAVSDALVTTGSLHVIQIVAENLGARLSSKAIDVLVSTARLASIVQKPIMSRPELSPDKAIELFWWVSKDLRREAVERYGFGPGRLDDALGKSIEAKLKTHLFEKDSDEAMIQLSNWLMERDAVSTKLLPQLLRLNHYRLFSITLSRMTGLDLKAIDAVVRSTDVRLIVSLCRAIGVDKGSFVSVFLMSRAARNDEQIVNPRELSLALETFDRLNVEDSLALIESWKENPQDLVTRTEKNVA